MNILELFAGTASVGKEFEKRGHKLFTVDTDSHFKPDLVADIMTLDRSILMTKAGVADVIWASPPCNCFSVASIYRHWISKNKGKYIAPKSEGARASMALIQHTLSLIKSLNPEFWFLENPRAMLRKMPFMRPYQRVTITYCQYGDHRQKPTDIWGNRLKDLKFKPPCRPGSDCHEGAPRGSNRGSQGLRNPTERARIPSLFGQELCEQVEKIMKGKKITLQTTLEVGK